MTRIDNSEDSAGQWRRECLHSHWAMPFVKLHECFLTQAGWAEAHWPRQVPILHYSKRLFEAPSMTAEGTLIVLLSLEGPYMREECWPNESSAMRSERLVSPY